MGVGWDGLKSDFRGGTDIEGEFNQRRAGFRDVLMITLLSEGRKRVLKHAFPCLSPALDCLVLPSPVKFSAV